MSNLLSKNCDICGNAFTPRHSNHTTCKNTACVIVRRKRTHDSWRSRTGRMNPTGQNIWSKEDVQFLHDNRFLDTKIIASQLNRSSSAIKEKRSRLSIPQLAECRTCQTVFKRINQHGQCETCTPNQRGYAKNYRDSLNGRWQMYKNGAIKRGLVFELTIDGMSTFWQKPCAYCNSSIPTVGIDRIDSSKGYIEGNLTSCCFTCNAMKNDSDLSSWLFHMKLVLNNLGESL